MILANICCGVRIFHTYIIKNLIYIGTWNLVYKENFFCIEVQAYQPNGVVLLARSLQFDNNLPKLSII